ncbi:uncharacterized protein FIBRA_04088 [Fibroporia radiculosa]|uniref:F-box domain-containing protein n=1 Tax=Fibroporia radiculosa TaxID=599839 RepID=J4HWC3_9APHY|nr:uncharacterized protein FIBRA_04088 [Fibroporia radiculosa]CCM02012.1 predicted protein [Fibroporia radiculosa]
MARDPSIRNLVKTVTIRSAGALGPFSLCLARKLSQVETLEFVGKRWPLVEWKPILFHVDLFAHMNATFETVTHLSLFHVEFASVVIFGRLLSALPRLVTLVCRRIYFKTCTVILGAARPPKNLIRLKLEDGSGVVDYLDAISSAIHLVDLTVWFEDESEVRQCNRMLQVAGTSLSSLHIDTNGLRGQASDIKLMQNVNLQVFVLTVSTRAQFVGWLSAIGSGMLPRQLREIRILLSELNPRTDPKDLLASNGGNFYGRIDDLLTGPSYLNLNLVSVELRPAIYLTRREYTKHVPTQDEWWNCLSSRFPQLCAQGILRLATLLWSTLNG